MHRFRRLLWPALLLAGSAWAGELRSLTILHVNDLHAHLSPNDRGRGGFAYLLTAIRQQRQGCAGCVLLNAGDLVQGTPVSTIFHGLPVYQVANRFGFDVATLGNHEFDYGWRMVPKFLKTARYPIVCANVVDGRGRLMARKPYVILKVNGIRLGVIGVAMGNLPDFETPQRMGDWKALPVLETVHRYAAELKGRADVICVLAHVTDGEAEALLHQAPEIAFVVSGHTHTGLKTLQEDHGRVHVRLNGYGTEMGRLELQVEMPEGTVRSWAWKRVPIDDRRLPLDPGMAAVVRHWERRVAAEVDVPIGQSRRALPGREVRTLIERAMREETGADFAFINAGGVRDGLPEGKLLARHVWNVMPFDNAVVVGSFRGAELPPVVRDGRQVDPSRTYKLAVTDFTAANQSQHSQLGTQNLKFSTDGPLLRDLLIHWIQRKQVIP